MSSFLGLLSIYGILIKIIDMIFYEKKKPNYKTQNKKIYQKIFNQIGVGEELKKINENKPIYGIPEKKTHNFRGTIRPAHEGIINWNKAFLKSLEWKRYEDVCMEYLRIKNCDASVTCTGADGGIDIKVCDKNGNMLAIGQCKAWNKPIGVSLIRELYGVMASERIKVGIFLTTSIFSQDAIEFAKNKTLLLIDADEFVNLINGLDDISKRRMDHVATEGDYSTPTCVNCNVKMVKRVTKKGNNAGNEFWGCINYPKCKRTMYVKI
jgi:restriction system protein